MQKIKTKRYHPFHQIVLFEEILGKQPPIKNDSLQFIQLFIYWISIFSTTVALEKIKGSVKLFKSTCEIEKWNI